MIMVKLINIDHQILLPKIMSQFKVKIKRILIKHRHKHRNTVNVYEKLH